MSAPHHRAPLPAVPRSGALGVFTRQRRVMDVYYDTIVSSANRDIVEPWISENNSDDIDYVTIDEGIVRGRPQ